MKKSFSIVFVMLFLFRGENLWPAVCATLQGATEVQRVNL